MNSKNSISFLLLFAVSPLTLSAFAATKKPTPPPAAVNNGNLFICESEDPQDEVIFSVDLTDEKDRKSATVAQEKMPYSFLENSKKARHVFQYTPDNRNSNQILKVSEKGSNRAVILLTRDPENQGEQNINDRNDSFTLKIKKFSAYLQVMPSLANKKLIVDREKVNCKVSEWTINEESGEGTSNSRVSHLASQNTNTSIRTESAVSISPDMTSGISSYTPPTPAGAPATAPADLSEADENF